YFFSLTPPPPAPHPLSLHDALPIFAAIASAPISAYLFGGVTGGGTDVIVAALRQGGSDVYNASLGQGFFSDPIDKVITSFEALRSEEHTSELQSRENLVCRLLLEKK